MKIGYFSDLHIEYMTELDAKTFGEGLRAAYREADVIVAAGDIGIGPKSIQFLVETFPNQNVIFVPGNHDYWCGEIHSMQRQFHEACQGTRVQYLDGDTIEIDGVLFCGATLWSDYALTNNQYAMRNAAYAMTDHRKIMLNDSPVRPEDLLGLHHEHLAAIKTAMGSAGNRPLIVVSHHAPSSWSLASDHDRPTMQANGIRCYGYSDTDPCYASHLDYLMLGPSAPKVWIHGHTHIAVDYAVGQCRVISNPKGYGNGEDTDWQLGRMIELES